VIADAAIAIDSLSQLWESKSNDGDYVSGGLLLSRGKVPRCRIQWMHLVSIHRAGSGPVGYWVEITRLVSRNRRPTSQLRRRSPNEIELPGYTPEGGALTVMRAIPPAALHTGPRDGGACASASSTVGSLRIMGQSHDAYLVECEVCTALLARLCVDC
jgi:hypothetical protein